MCCIFSLCCCTYSKSATWSQAFIIVTSTTREINAGAYLVLSLFTRFLISSLGIVSCTLAWVFLPRLTQPRKFLIDVPKNLGRRWCRSCQMKSQHWLSKLMDRVWNILSWDKEVPECDGLSLVGDSPWEWGEWRSSWVSGISWRQHQKTLLCFTWQEWDTFCPSPKTLWGTELEEVYLIQEALGQRSVQTVNGKFCYLPSNIQCELVVKRRRWRLLLG